MLHWIPFALRKIATLLRKGTPQRASTISLIACMILASVSIVLGLFEQSLIMQTNGYIMLIDFGNSLLFLAAVDRSARNADLTFNYGYGKYESLAILVSANLLLVLAVVTIGEAVSTYRLPPPQSNTWILLVWSVLAFFVMRTTAGVLARSAKRNNMAMLQYDAELWRTDSWMELVVIAGLCIGGALQSVQRYGWARIVDATVSVALIGLTTKVPLQGMKEAFRQLLDRTLPDEMQYEILAIIAENYTHMCAFRSVHTRRSGKDIFIEIDLLMPYDYTLERLYELEKSILDGLQQKFPTAIPRVYVTPCDHACERSGTTTCPVKTMPGIQTQ
jgi:cation diffusion facilitator family transporter